MRDACRLLDGLFCDGIEELGASTSFSIAERAALV